MSDDFNPQDDLFLQQLLADTRLIDHVSNGDLHLFREILLRQRAETFDPDHQAAIDMALWNPNLFVREPLPKAPTLFTLNGIGTSLYGKKHLDQTGFRIATLFFTFVFIPIFPLRRYLVRSDDNRNFEFYARVPMSAGLRFWQLSWALGAVGTAFIFALAILWAMLFHVPTSQVQFVNAFDQAVIVTVDGEEEFFVPALSNRAFSLEAGDRNFTTYFDDQRFVEEFVFNVPERTDLVVYNVAAMAPAYVQSVTYFDTARPHLIDDPNFVEDYEMLVGKRRYTRHGVRYIDREPPEEIDLFYGQDRQVHWGFFYNGEPASLGIHYIPYDTEPALYVETLARLIELQPSEDFSYLVWAAVYNSTLSAHKSQEQWVHSLKETGRALPDAISVHDLLIHLAYDFYKDDFKNILRPYYEALVEKTPTATTMVSLARTAEDVEDAVALLKSALELADDGVISRAEVYYRLGDYMTFHRDCPQANQYFGRAAEIDRSLFHYAPTAYVECLVKEGGAPRAYHFLMELIEETEFPYELVRLAGRAALSDRSANLDPFAPLVLMYRQNPLVYGELTEYSRLSYALEIGLPLQTEQFPELGADEAPLLELNQALFTALEHPLEYARANPSLIQTSGYNTNVLLVFIAMVRGEEKLATSLSHIDEFEHIAMNNYRAITNEFRFDETPPWDWDSDLRAAYYVAQAFTTEDRSATGESLQKALDVSPFWGPVKAIAQAFLDEN